MLRGGQASPSEGSRQACRARSGKGGTFRRVTISLNELQLATRNHGMPLEALRWDVTPVGLHYLLVHYDIPLVDPESWRLEIHGSVEHPLALTLDDVRAREAVEVVATMECAGNGRARMEPRAISQPWLHEAIGTGRWRGVPLGLLLAEAGPRPNAVDVVFTGLDHGVEGGVEQSYQRAVPLDEAMAGESVLAYELNGQPLPPQHGFPLRLLVPGWYGMTNVKWLTRIDVLDQRFDGYQHATAYRFRSSEDDSGTPVTRMVPRALMVPPGRPDFLTRTRHVAAGSVHLEGRAWSGSGSISGVDVSTDGGVTWTPAELEPADGPAWRWRRWTATWHAEPGEHVLSCRTRDDSGRTQPDQAEWNLGGYANNSVQRVPVVVSA
jgi:DMSO/TMAO reductase YedYZ molybdopterin-dependent catalytic subunit